MSENCRGGDFLTHTVDSHLVQLSFLPSVRRQNEYQLLGLVMVNVFYFTGFRLEGVLAQADHLGPKVSSHLVLCCIHCMNRVNSYNSLSINIILVIYYYFF